MPFPLLVICLFICGFVKSQKQPFATIDIVQGSAKMEKELLYFYRHNWKVFRETALSNGFISSYDMILTPTDSLGFFKLLLITEYPDSLSLVKSEVNFRPILEKLRTHGPKYLNDVQRKDFLEYLNGYEGKILYSDFLNKTL